MISNELKSSCKSFQHRFFKTSHFDSGTGVVVGAISAISERQPIVLGKPNKMFLEVAQTT